MSIESSVTYSTELFHPVKQESFDNSPPPAVIFAPDPAATPSPPGTPEWHPTSPAYPEPPCLPPLVAAQPISFQAYTGTGPPWKTCCPPPSSFVQAAPKLATFPPFTSLKWTDKSPAPSPPPLSPPPLSLAKKKQKLFAQFRQECIENHQCTCSFCPIKSLNQWAEEVAEADLAGTFV